MVLVNHDLLVAEGRCHLRGDLGIDNWCAAADLAIRNVVVEHGVILGDHLQWGAQRRERPPVHRVTVRSSDDIGTCLVELAVNSECSGVDRAVANDDVAVMIDTDQITDGHEFEIMTKRIHPETIGEFRISHRHVASNTLGKIQPSHGAKSSSQALLTVEALGLEIHFVSRFRL